MFWCLQNGVCFLWAIAFHFCFDSMAIYCWGSASYPIVFTTAVVAKHSFRGWISDSTSRLALMLLITPPPPLPIPVCFPFPCNPSLPSHLISVSLLRLPGLSFLFNWEKRRLGLPWNDGTRLLWKLHQCSLRCTHLCFRGDRAPFRGDTLCHAGFNWKLCRFWETMGLRKYECVCVFVYVPLWVSTLFVSWGKQRCFSACRQFTMCTCLLEIDLSIFSLFSNVCN